MPRKKKLKFIEKEDRLATVAKKKGRVPMPKYVLKLTDYLYITCDSRCWMIKEVVEGVDKDGNKRPDKALCYAVTLEGILQVAAQRMVRVPGDVMKLADRMKEIYDLIDARVPVGIKPKDLFEVYQTSGDEEIDDDD